MYLERFMFAHRLQLTVRGVARENETFQVLKTWKVCISACFSPNAR
ncbi:hypothetical protein [Methylobacter sp.]